MTGSAHLHCLGRGEEGRAPDLRAAGRADDLDVCPSCRRRVTRELVGMLLPRLLELGVELQGIVALVEDARPADRLDPIGARLGRLLEQLDLVVSCPEACWAGDME